MPTPYPTGVYGDISDIQAEMGRYNEQVAADPDNEGDGTTIITHEQKAIAFADAFINSRLSMASLATPATVQLDMLKIIFAKMGAWQLYRIRGLQDEKDKFEEKFAWAKNQLEELIYNNRGGFTVASGVVSAIAPVAPSVTAFAGGACRPYWNGLCWVW